MPPKPSPRTRGQSDQSDTVVNQILAQAPDENTALSMLVGSRLEGGWGPKFAVGDNGLAVGPFQEHPGYGSFAQRDDPRYAVSAILRGYEGAVAQVGEQQFASDPEHAAEQAAYLAERPAQDYYASEGSTKVHESFVAASNVLSGNPVTAGTNGTTGGAIQGTDASVGGAIAGAGSDLIDHIPILGGILKGATTVEKFFDFMLHLLLPSNLVRLGMSILGTVLIGVGIFFLARDA